MYTVKKLITNAVAKLTAKAFSKKALKAVSVLTAVALAITVSAPTLSGNITVYAQSTKTTGYFGSQIPTLDGLTQDQRTDCVAAYNALLTITEDTKQITVNTPSNHVFNTPDEAADYTHVVMYAALDAYVRDHPETFWISITNSSWQISYPMDGKPFTLEPYTYTITPEDAYTPVSQYTSRFNAAVSLISVDTSSRYATVKSIHDGICRLTTYGSSASSYDAYGAIVGGMSVCEGYAKAFKVLCDSYNVPCIILMGNAIDDDGNVCSHTWNYVQMEDGKWYAVDLTWDDCNDSTTFYDFFLAGADSVVSGFGQVDMYTFSQNHTATGGYFISETAVFTYPELSKSSYSAQGNHTDSSIQSSGTQGGVTQNGSSQNIGTGSVTSSSGQSQSQSQNASSSGNNTAGQKTTSASGNGSTAAMSTEKPTTAAGTLTPASTGTPASTKTSAENTSDSLTGDVDGNGAVDATDVRLALQSVLRLVKLTASQTIAADADKDGNVTAADVAALILISDKQKKE